MSEHLNSSELARTLDGGGIWGPTFVKTIVFLVLLSTASFALSTVETFSEENSGLFTGIEYFCVIIFTIEYCLRLWVAENVFTYVIHPIAIVDLLSVLPSWLDLVIPGDAFPALQFLRMLRLFKFLSASEKGMAAMEAFGDSWKENKSLIVAASFAGGAVWLVTASLQYFAERNNDDMNWCYPPADGPAGDCECNDDGCEGDDCECVKRFGSIPSAMFFVLLNLSGEFPLADQHSTLGRFISVATAVISVGIFAIPTGLIGAALEGAIGALNSGKEADYDVDDDDVAEIAAEARALLGASNTSSSQADELPVVVPPFTVTKLYKTVCGMVICLSAVIAVLSTMRSMPTLAIVIFYVLDIVCAIFFFVDHAARIVYAGPQATKEEMTSSLLPLADLLSWLPTAIYVLGGIVACPPYIFLTIALCRMIKYERYARGFRILGRVVDKSQGVLAIGGMAAACCLVFCSTLMYYSERNNPDPKMRSYYSSVPTAMWMTMLNLSGEAPLCDYTLFGRVIVGMLSIVAVAVFAVPVGALGAGFEGVISEIASAEDEVGDGHAREGDDGEGISLSTWSPGRSYGATDGVSPSLDATHVESNGVASSSVRLVEGRGSRGQIFQSISIFATLFAVALEVISTCEFASSTDTARRTVAVCEAVVVVWFTVEYLLRFIAHGFKYMFSWLGVVDFVSTFPWYIARGLLGSYAAGLMDVYDGPLRALRLLRLVRLDTYAPSISLVDDAFRACWPGLSVACYAGAVLLFLFNECMYFAERHDKENGEDKRFRSALSSLQYSAVLLTGDYPITDFSFWGKICCAVAVVVAVGIVAVPASILAGAFVDILQNNAEKRRRQRYDAAVKMQRLFLRKRDKQLSSKEAGKGSAFQQVVEQAITHSAVLRGLDSPNPPLAARICIWKNGKSYSAACYHYAVAVMIGTNILAVVLESEPVVEAMLPHAAWQTFETFSVGFFTVEYIMNCFTAPYDPRWNFSTLNMMCSFVGMADLIAIIPYYVQVCLLPVLFPRFVFDATIFRIFRLARILELEKFFKAFSLLDDVLVQAAPVLKATGVVALIVWVGGATMFYYLEPHNEDEAESAARGGEDAAVFTSILDALYYTAIFLAGEWSSVDFTPLGSVLCTAMALIGVALFSIPVGVLFEGFQDMLTEQHACVA